MEKPQQELAFRRWGGARRGAGRKRTSVRLNVPHRVRRRFRKGALHVTVRIRREVWNLRTHRCFRALRRAFERGCQRFGFRLVHFSVQGNHAHFIVEAPDAQALGRASALRRRPILLRGLSGVRAAAGCGANLVDALRRHPRGERR
jgi:hypothetical protein